ncbi:hypothetical protein LIER_25193 [Lithospermum erythrorhizon]|uniref:DUF3741 domain-containing protein n=1 Tax=Lithospermum erythrorhizon TaxID=34254 RepID=A0AAV3R719_LITER
MKDISLFLLKNLLGARMRKGFKNFCNGDASTSTLNQQKPDHPDSNPAGMGAAEQSFLPDDMYEEHVDTSRRPSRSHPTLEEMILQLELEEKIARRAKLSEYGEIKHRMSCVNSSDILRTARNALNQYPRFSLDGKDSLYRSSFRNLPRPSVSKGSRRSSCCSNDFDPEVRNKISPLPSIFAGEHVVWCKPGVVAKLMGLDAMPVPYYRKKHLPHGRDRERLSEIMRRQNLRQRAERHEMERRLVLNTGRRCGGGGTRRGVMRGSCSSHADYCAMKPVAMEVGNEDTGWPMHHFL